MSVINNIDYDHLAHLAKTSKTPFHLLCQRAEKGLPLNNLEGKIPTTIRMTDEELALELGTDLPTVLTHRRD